MLILAALVAIWRLMQGPIELNWLAPYVQAGFDRAGVGLKVAVGGVQFGIDRETHELDLWAEDVRLSLPNGMPLARLPQMSTSASLSDLLRGQIAPTQVVIEHPILHLIREQSGAISAQIGNGDGPKPDIGPDLIEQLAGPPGPNSLLGRLHDISIRGASLRVDDRQSGREWRADKVDIALQRGTKGARGDVSLTMPIGTSHPELHASFRYLADRQLFDLDMSIDGVLPTEIPPLTPELAQLQHIEAPVSGTLTTRIDLAKGEAQGSRLDLALGTGRLHSEWLPTGTVMVRKGEMRLTYAPERSEMRIDGFKLDLDGGSEVVADGKLTGVTPQMLAAPPDARPPGQLTGDINAGLRNVSPARLSELWPVGFSPGGRRWVLANVHDGEIDEAMVHAIVDLDPAAHVGKLDNATGTLRYHDLTVNYLNGLPLAHKVTGTANFVGKELDFVPSGGGVKGLNLTGGTLRITDIGDKVEHLAVDLNAAGPLRDALEVIDSKPLEYAHALGIDPAQVTGHTDVQVHFKLPLLADVKMDQIEYSAKVSVAGATLDAAVVGHPVSNGDIGIDVAKTGAHAQGAVRFDGIPAKVDGNIFFHEKSGPHAIYKVGMTLDDEAQRRLSLDLAPDRLSGPIGVEAVYQAFSGEHGDATATLDLKDATIAIAEAGWRKPAGQPANAKVALDINHDQITSVPQIELRAAGLDGRFSGTLAPDHKHLDRVDIRRMIVGDSDVSGIVSRRVGGGWRADIHAARIDARRLFKDATTGVAAPDSVPLAVNARIDRLSFGAGRELQQVTAALARNAGVWQSGQVAAQFTNGHKLAMRFGEGNSERLLFQTDDMGATLQLLDMGADVSGGQLTIDGQLSQTAGKRSLRAHIEGSNYTLVRASPMTRILALPSLTGFGSMLAGAGLPFMILRGDFTYSGSRLSLDRVLAFGEALGITTNGWFDLDRDQLELQGTVAPAYALNSIIGNVPIVGQLLGGGSEGLFAANFRLNGSSDNPQVTVNPLSALAPGILRQIFSPIVGVASPVGTSGTPGNAPAPGTAVTAPGATAAAPAYPAFGSSTPVPAAPLAPAAGGPAPVAPPAASSTPVPAAPGPMPSSLLPATPPVAH